MGGGAASAEGLLAAADVRFDFSQYTDVDDMVDVNGGWGPLVPTFVDVASSTFTADGLSIVGAAATYRPDLAFTGNSPIVFNSDGLTYCGVLSIDGPHVASPATQTPFATVWCNHSSDQAPALFTGWLLNSTGGAGPGDYGTATVQDGPPNTNNIARNTSMHTTDLADAATGVLIAILTINVADEEATVRYVSPAGDDVFVLPFAYTPPDWTLSSPAVVNRTFRSTGSARWLPQFTYIEDLWWNRALTPAEVDALVAHFTA